MSVLLTLAVLVTVTSPCSVWASAVRPSLTTTTASTRGAPSLSGPGSNSRLSTTREGSTTQSSFAPGGSATNAKENSTDGSSSTSTTTTRATTTEADVTTNAGGTSDFGETTPGAAPPVNNVTTVTPEETATRLASGDGCIESEIPNFMNIGQCLGDDLDLCAGKTTVMQAYMSLVRCTAKGTFENMSPLNGLIALRDIFTTIVHRFSPRAAAIIQNINFKPDGSDLNDNICQKPIKLGFPNSLGKCLADTYKLCDDGEMVDVSFATSFAAAVACGFTELVTTAPIDTYRHIVCDIVKGSQATFGVLPFIGYPTYEMAKMIFC